MNRARIEREYLPFQSFLIAWPTSQKLGEEERWPRNVSIDTPIRLVWGAAHPPSLLSPRNRNLASSLLVSAAGKQSEYSLLAVSEEQISPVYALDGSRRLSRERLTCLETSSCACVCVSLHITRREINQSVEISSRVWLEELLSFDYARTFGIARFTRRVEHWETNGDASFRVLGREERRIYSIRGKPIPSKTGIDGNIGVEISFDWKSRGRKAFNVECWWRVVGFSWRGRNLERAVDFSIFQHRMRVNKQGEEREEERGNVGRGKWEEGGEGKLVDGWKWKRNSRSIR